jgi:spermidine/putrescine-binding protein
MLGLPDWQAKSWKDLGDPRLFGTVTAGDPRTSGSVRMLYELILQTYGWEEGFRQLLRLGANTRTFARFSDGVTKDVVFGRAAVGGSLDSYAFSAMTREQRDLADGLAGEAILDFIFPPGEVMLNPDSIGILKGAPHRKLAEAFVEYNLSEDGGQRLWMLQPNTLPGSPQRYAICRLGVMPDLYDTQTFPLTVRSVTINPFDEVQVGKLVEYDNQLADSRRFLMQDLFGAWIIDSHDELSAAWRAVLRTRTQTPDPLEETLFAPPCSHQEIPALVAQMRKGPRRRAELQTHWLAEARQRYRQVRVAAEER